MWCGVPPGLPDFAHWQTPSARSWRRRRRPVTGEVTLQFYKGTSTLAGRTSPFSLYKHDLATHGTGDAYDHTAAEGFIKLWGLPLRVAGAVRKPKQARAKKEHAKPKA